MAKIIKDEEMPPSRNIYPWDEWFDGQARSLEKGEDFKSPTPNFANYIRRVAERKELSVLVRVKGKTIYVQAHLDSLA